MDAKSIVEVLQNVDYVNNALSPIIDDCRQLITRFHHVCIKHCFWQANQCADGLARMSCRMNAEFLIYEKMITLKLKTNTRFRTYPIEIHPIEVSLKYF